ncbi:D-Arabinono-1,4-lactone oxidase [Emiliania huxleyi CCMP1516]|uniref:FAD-binding PCMH-type domain-containing protein n=2 Tax=Emiliania huxleyi TaxID=2903 RepID=A0A0D3JN86_EMIH1|nr:hypothetical protein EMIHUDRAFT_238054 [Emiliania huxleyi CCMP1516]XP_005781761.1 D-Arabinono-1,4-lactone oxidase [Emiliania huxleyi CCMP1516]EOD24971.1 hypothetical protein EMIHUDRAFT_238054 [Emiliania huxleyi CCMP1516]EOD29332.1 D-Arabinono-1,4-lactone oxidase [Emiliania huxleyi CCMP1516]|eukprot:XP_005777400.1 hypothetical protein EMIHUDRAFT_238054 [Emiliania huxleyi CCMP1516]
MARAIPPKVVPPSAQFMARRRAENAAETGGATTGGGATAAATPWVGPVGCASFSCLTSANVCCYWLSCWQYHLLEGRQRCCGACETWSNWTCATLPKPASIAKPATLEALSEVVKGAAASGQSVRVVGIWTDGLLVSLDRVSDTDVTPVKVNGETHCARHGWGGTRMRDLTRMLSRHGLAIAALPSHNAQSLCSLYPSGSARDVGLGFVSDSVIGLDIVDGAGMVHHCSAADPDTQHGFRAAIGGIGASGIIAGATFRVVPAFCLHKSETTAGLPQTLASIEDLVASNEHTALLVFPFADQCLLQTWNRTEEAPRCCNCFEVGLELTKESLQNCAISWLLSPLSSGGCLPGCVGRLQPKIGGCFPEQVLDSADAFTQTLYPLHQELEFTVPRAKTAEVTRDAIALYESLYRSGAARPWMAIEVRFTPPEHRQSYLSAGADFGEEPFDDFLAVRDAADARATFSNALTERLFGLAA